MDEIPLSKMSFLVQPNEKFGWVAIAMETANGSTYPIAPRKIGAGISPPAALLRCLTPLRLNQPTADECRITLGDLITLRGLSIRRIAHKVPYSERTLSSILNGEIWLQPNQYIEIAELSGIDSGDWRKQLLVTQQALDRAREYPS